MKFLFISIITKQVSCRGLNSLRCFQKTEHIVPNRESKPSYLKKTAECICSKYFGCLSVLANASKLLLVISFNSIGNNIFFVDRNSHYSLLHHKLYNTLSLSVFFIGKAFQTYSVSSAWIHYMRESKRLGFHWFSLHIFLYFTIISTPWQRDQRVLSKSGSLKERVTASKASNIQRLTFRLTKPPLLKQM